MPEYGKNGTTLNLEHLVLKSQNASQWQSSYVLAAGEIGIELDTGKYKLGDGTTTWGELSYYTNPQSDAIVTALTTRVTTAEGTLTSLGTRMDTAESDIDAVEGRMDTAEADIDALEAKDVTHESRMTAIEGVNTSQGTTLTDHETRITSIEGITTISANPFRE